MKAVLLWGAALAAGLSFGASDALAADAAAGKEVFKECMACHTVEQGKNRVGPSLHGVVGRKAASVETFKYSKPMQEKAASGLTWTPDTLKQYLQAPKEVVPGTSMAYAGLKNAAKYKANPDQATENLIAYLEESK